jgi:hypothetical protein
MSIPIIDEVVEQLKVMPQPLQRLIRWIAGKSGSSRHTRAAIVAFCWFNSF